jgi:hypothetical protein
MWEEHRMRMSENRGRIFGLNREEVKRKLKKIA